MRSTSLWLIARECQIRVSCIKTDPAGAETWNSPGIGACWLMPSSGPRGLRGSLCDPGTIHVPPLNGVTSSGPRYQTVASAMQTSGKGWATAPQCFQGALLLGLYAVRSCGQSECQLRHLNCSSDSGCSAGFADLLTSVCRIRT